MNPSPSVCAGQTASGGGLLKTAKANPPEPRSVDAGGKGERHLGMTLISRPGSFQQMALASIEAGIARDIAGLLATQYPRLRRLSGSPSHTNLSPVWWPASSSVGSV